MRDNAALGKMLDEASRILGVFFGQSESMRLVSAIDYFGLEPEYMLLVCAHCAGNGRRSVGAVMKKVAELFDEGVVTVEDLEDRLRLEEKTGSLEQQVRTLFGISRSRALSDKERQTLERWSGEFEYGIDVIRRAYNITIDTIGEPSLGYANAILRKWFDVGLRSVEEVDAFLKKSKKETKKSGGEKSFDSEDFFKAALQRSYGPADTPAVASAPGQDSPRNFGRPVTGKRNT
ncbi:MAG: DnaD domain protein [Clostridia bacterium]|nr:DnaD domain protein [Clostridia bacterium]